VQGDEEHQADEDAFSCEHAIHPVPEPLKTQRVGQSDLNENYKQVDITVSMETTAKHLFCH